MGPIRVLLAEDHILVREGVRALLEAQPDMEVVAEASDGSEAVRKALDLLPDVVLMDITMPGTNGLEATRLIRKAAPGVRILALTMHGTDDYFFRLLDAGASGYVLKESASSDLISAIRAVHRGGVFLSPSVAKRLVDDYLRRASEGDQRPGYDSLTDRERQILKLIGEGCTNQEIAQKLCLSVNTVQTHRTHIMDK
ncbi:MAG TPA: response regulator transcription factor, partial [Dehalococcoidia bacterium]|nr:response regulator transcription factor [Dehalococcoidia bacterium]